MFTFSLLSRLISVMECCALFLLVEDAIFYRDPLRSLRTSILLCIMTRIDRPPPPKCRGRHLHVWNPVSHRGHPELVGEHQPGPPSTCCGKHAQFQRCPVGWQLSSIKISSRGFSSRSWNSRRGHWQRETFRRGYSRQKSSEMDHQRQPASHVHAVMIDMAVT